MRMVQKIAAMLLMAGLMGCGSGPYVKDLEALDAAPSCCADYSAFTYEKLKIGSEQNASVTTEAQAFTFATGKSYFRAYEIPEQSAPFYLQVISRPGSRRVFFPTVLVLDGLFRPTRHIGEPIIRWHDDNYAPTSASIEGTLYFDPVRSGERYIVILTVDRAQAEAHAAATPDLMVATGRGFMMMPGKEVTLEPGPVGTIRIKSGRL